MDLASLPPFPQIVKTSFLVDDGFCLLMQCNNSITVKIWTCDRISLTQPLHSLQVQKSMIYSQKNSPSYLSTIPSPSSSCHRRWSGRLRSRSPCRTYYCSHWTKVSQGGAKNLRCVDLCCSVLLYVVGLCTWRSKLWKIARWGRRRIHWQATDPTTKNWFSIQPEGFKTNLRLAFGVNVCI